MKDFEALQTHELGRFDRRYADTQNDMHSMLDSREEKFHDRLGRCYIEIEKFSKQYDGKFKVIDRKLEIEVSISNFCLSYFLFSEFLNFVIRERKMRQSSKPEI
jgi:hypothetical protein